MSANARELCLTELDVVRLESMLDRVRRRSPGERPVADDLELRVETARVVDARAIGPQVVTMNSVVALTDRATGSTSEVTLVYPQDADAERSRISVLSPVGRALLGVHVGDVLRVAVPGERNREFVVAGLPYQPEASGRYDL